MNSKQQNHNVVHTIFELSSEVYITPFRGNRPVSEEELFEGRPIENSVYHQLGGGVEPVQDILDRVHSVQGLIVRKELSPILSDFLGHEPAEKELEIVLGVQPNAPKVRYKIYELPEVELNTKGYSREEWWHAYLVPGVVLSNLFEKGVHAKWCAKGEKVYVTNVLMDFLAECGITVSAGVFMTIRPDYVEAPRAHLLESKRLERLDLTANTIRSLPAAKSTYAYYFSFLNGAYKDRNGELLKDLWHDQRLNNSVPDAVLYVIETYWFELDSDNGGINQYLYNQLSSASNLEALRWVIEGYRAFGCNTIANLVESNLTFFESLSVLYREALQKGTWEGFTETYEETGLEDLDLKDLDEELRLAREKDQLNLKRWKWMIANDELLALEG